MGLWIMLIHGLNWFESEGSNMNKKLSTYKKNDDHLLRPFNNNEKPASEEKEIEKVAVLNCMYSALTMCLINTYSTKNFGGFLNSQMTNY